MSDTLNRYRETASGLTETTRKGVDRIVGGLRRSRGAAGDLQQRLMQRSQQNRDAVAGLLRTQTQKVVKRMGLATRADVERLQRQLANLRQRTTAAQQAGRTTPRSATEATAGRTAEMATGAGAARKRAKKAARPSTTVGTANEAASEPTASQS